MNVHGLAVEVRCALPGLRQIIDDLLGSLAVQDFPEGFSPVDGSIESYDADIVARHLSTTAERVATFGDYAELWRDQERCWLIDESWGVCEINLLKRTWRSWLLPQADLDPMRAVDLAVFWPMSQILSTRGLTILPAASVVHRGRGVLLICPFNLEPELALLTTAGHGLISQRWTALREEEQRCVLLTMPGRVERSPIPQLRSRLKIDPQSLSASSGPEWIDLAATAPSLCPYAWCDTLLLVEPGRRAAATCKPLTGASSVAAIRRAWPLPELTHSQGHLMLAKRLGQSASVFQVELSRDPRALLRLLEQLPEEVEKRRSIEAMVHGHKPRVA
ncbi:MAG: hypothetical protein QM770_05320 [Tepidisphaeraceae bacterium]